METLKEVKNKIDKNYRYTRGIKQLIKLQYDDIEKMELITCLGKFYSENITGLYSDYELEEQLIQIGKKIVYKRTRKVTTGKILHVMTQASQSGGHPAIVNNWIKLDHTHQYSIVFTDMTALSLPQFLNESVEISGGEIQYLHGENYIEKAKELLEISQDYEKIIMHIHMFDIIPILAYCNSNWDAPVYFFNHANFKFSFGFSIADMVLNMNDYDQWKTKVYRGIEPERNRLLHLPGAGSIPEEAVDNPSKIRADLAQRYGFDQNAKIVITMGANFKYKKIIGCDFQLFVENLIANAENKTYFFIIGADPNSDRWINMKNKTNGRAAALGVLPREEVNKWMSIADLYIVAFPMSAAGIFEAINKGVPCLRLVIVKRSLEFWNDISVFTINELIEKSIKILKSGKRLNDDEISYFNKKWDKQQWLIMLNAIYNIPLTHQIHRFKQQRYVKKEEYINCQLMDEAAPKCYQLAKDNFNISSLNKLLIKVWEQNLL